MESLLRLVRDQNLVNVGAKHFQMLGIFRVKNLPATRGARQGQIKLEKKEDMFQSTRPRGARRFRRN